MLLTAASNNNYLGDSQKKRLIGNVPIKKVARCMAEACNFTLKGVHDSGCRVANQCE